LVDTNNGCTTEQNITITEDRDLPVIALAGNFELPCDQLTGTLSASINIAPGIANISWSSQGGSITSGGNTLNPAISGSGTYQITVINTETGCQSTATAEVIASGSPASLYEVGQIDCFGDNDGYIKIENVSGGEPPYRYFLNGTESVSPIFRNLTPGNYTITIRDSRNCSKDTVVTILEGDRVEILLPPALSLIYGETSIIEAVVNLTPDQIRSIQWTPSTNLSHDDRLVTEVTALTPTDYTIRITSINGCVAEKSIRLSIERNIRVTIPNIIRPGTRFPNDRFTIFANEEVDFVSKMYIYDRWGNLVFSKENFPHSVWTEGWDGKFNGSDVVSGVFVYLIEVVLKDSNEEKRVYTGDITIIR
jgi:gliding motility-associated-like protein